ncbi:polysaccharide biosynthesis protein [Thiocapsa bogorovii]|uniref:polysaccharide biosynthesis protein n=1 Tax=Thiocapsa bogorovii TaxID=521689 RepID=UPI001E57B7B7|nr:nucleoside-diphosphate sugar epimerase/dehydratase [Thiocapsa bogorovii]UHD15492.1 polysaccharide biosynthesis protein [Thiocapsa bogorovii]
MKIWFQRARSRLLVFLHDLLMIPMAWGLAYWMRFNLAYVPPEFIDEAIDTLPLVVLVIGSVYWMFGLYRGVWRFASMDDLVRIAQAVLVGTTLLLFLLFALNRMAYIPRSLPALFVIFQLMLLVGPRLLYRWMKDRRLDFSGGKRVLIVGAGRAGEMLVRDLLRDPKSGYVPVAFVDDKPHRQGGVVHGVPIRGTTNDIPQLAENFGIDVVLLAAPSASTQEMRRLVGLCESAGRPFRTVPRIKELMDGQVSVNQLRSVSIEDLLGREPVTLDWDGIRRGLADRLVMVSGAGGSIGSELCRQLRSCGLRRLILLDHGEYNLYQIETELLDSPSPRIFARYLVDITNAVAVNDLFNQLRPDVVFHAAAYKHVPLLEDQIQAALHNNVIGTRIIASAADRCGCERFVLISTDKAVNPSNVMGASKRFAELLCQDIQSRSACRFMTVRFGNVLGSAGSVVPRFRQQIERGGPVTVTHPDIERFFMTIPEACQLIMQAAVIGKGGETFVLDMGTPVKIHYLAEQMIRLSGLVPDRDIKIEFTGLRPGEKLFEELFYPSEGFAETPHPRIHIARRTEAPGADLLRSALSDLVQALSDRDDEAARSVLGRVVPDWNAEQGKEAGFSLRAFHGIGRAGQESRFFPVAPTS